MVVRADNHGGEQPEVRAEVLAQLAGRAAGRERRAEPFREDGVDRLGGATWVRVHGRGLPPRWAGRADDVPS
ncbi:hypothetical protein Acy02nite_57210 [Actinoplanes cyaneus]|uniref:Uncharacterized protein n=1 Tax=Actinoplanes cyaneus TaxID=52696 RepID=A0A919ITN2_9ACTN|nr:hypothetical protein Acy02nite_57210 [Actinoplanes cyaneus]